VVVAGSAADEEVTGEVSAVLRAAAVSATAVDSATVAASEEDEVAIAEVSEAVVAETAAASEVDAARPEDADLQEAVAECAVAKQSLSSPIATKACSS